jgi:signal transduction histidine kinase
MRSGEKSTVPRWVVISVVATLILAAASVSVLLYVQEFTRNDIRRSLFERAQAEQIRATHTIAGKISTDLESISARLGQLATSQNFQEGDFTSSDSNSLFLQQFKALKSAYAIDALYILNDKSIVVNISTDDKNAIGFDASQVDYVKETLRTRAPVYSNRLVGIDNNSSIITISYPIINRHTGQYLGLVGVGIIAPPFFSAYGNIYEFKSAQYINVLDRNETFVASPNPAVVGKHFFDVNVQQQFVKGNTRVNDLYSKVFAGQPATAVFDVGFGERLVTGEPIIVNGKPTYYLTMGIPTSLIYSEIDSILASQSLFNNIQWIALLTGIGLLLLFLFRINNRLNVDIANRTKILLATNKQLLETNEKLAFVNEQLARANEQLKVHDKMQTEFINIAAHELRTPIQPILSTVDVLRYRIAGKPETNIADNQVAILTRNAMRLQKLSAEILDATRIEAGTLKLDREIMDINQKVKDVVADAESLIPKGTNLEIQFKPALIDAAGNPVPLLVNIDRVRMFEVISNLIRNAIKFSSAEGTIITVTTGKMGGDSVVVVSVKDTGSGISEEVLPNLFTKFGADKERGGTGLGLFIAKNIVEAHGGRIWAENNNDGPGATFSFTLPTVAT